MDKLAEIKQCLEMVLANQGVLCNLLGVIIKEMTCKLPVVAMQMKDDTTEVTYVAPSLESVILYQEESDSPSPKEV